MENRRLLVTLEEYPGADVITGAINPMPQGTLAGPGYYRSSLIISLDLDNTNFRTPNNK